MPWTERQRAFVQRVGTASLSDLETGTIVVLPSATFPVAELCKITGIQHYEERMLFTALLLRRPQVSLVYLTSLPVDPAVVDYYLRFLPDPEHARERIQLVFVGDDGPRPLTEKLLDRPDLIERVRGVIGNPQEAHVLPFNVTPAEERFADLLDLPVYGPHPDLVPLGSKTGSRRVARQAGVAVLPGSEDLRSLEDVEQAVQGLRASRPHAEAVVIKLNDGFSGQGNAIVELRSPLAPLPASNTTFCASEESWPSFAAKIAQGGAVVEELIRPERMASPSVQMRIAPAGTLEVVSTHDQILGGPDNQVYLGCRFPADPAYRSAIQEAALAVGEVLAGEGVMGSFGIDFVVVRHDGGDEVYLSEINLRMGGTTHPFWMARLASGGVYRAA
ncbi:MAG: ATP-grasp domain-containing protein, partial [Actinomycetota bacterium]|nr:ATP-grasp domain-containing protein [Actinomycetota bacterium]